MHRLALVVVAAAWMSAAAQDLKKDIDAFERQKITATYSNLGEGKGSVIRIKATQAIYPAGTEIVVMVRYLQGLSSEEHPYGDPQIVAQDGTQRRIASASAWVQEMQYDVDFKFKKPLPPGEYIITGVFHLSQQKRKTRSEYINQYVPAHERHNPCQFCQQHWGITKVQVADPAFELRPEFANQPGPLWMQQKLDYRDRVLSLYTDWYLQLISARETLRDTFHKVTHFGPTEMQAISDEVAKIPDGSFHSQVMAQLAWRVISQGMAESRDWLAHVDQQRKGLPADVHRFWRRVIFGDGVADERLDMPTPPSDSPDKPWSFNYVVPRIEIVRKEIVQYRTDAPVLVDPAVFAELVQLAESTMQLVKILDRQVDMANDTINQDRLIEKLESATGDQAGEIAKQLDEAFYSGFYHLHRDRQMLETQLEPVMNAIERKLKISITFPVGTWPIPDSIQEPPQNPESEHNKRLEETMGAMLSEVRKKLPK